MIHKAGSEWCFHGPGDQHVGVSLKDRENRRVLQLGAYVKDLTEKGVIIKAIMEHNFSLKDGAMKITPIKTNLKMRCDDPLRMEFLRRIDDSAIFGICPGAAFQPSEEGIKAHGICIYTKKEIIVAKSGTHTVSLAK